VTAAPSPGTLLALAALAGALCFGTVAVVGLVRLPDCYSRAHATSKSDTLGTLLALSAAAVAFGASSASFKLALLGLFVLVTAPTAAHAVVRSAYDQGIVPWTLDEGGEGE
jgi:multicomponent Na+:H+ antiporter subunit G